MSFGGFGLTPRRLPLALGALAVLLLCILVLPNATPAHAQTPATSQVKNTAQTTDSFWPKLEVNGPVLAQAFTTGNNPGGYQLESIGIRFGGIDDNEAHLINKLALRLETMSGNNPSGTWVTGLAPPFPLQAHAVNYFTASIRLKPNTTYAAVLTHSNRHAFFDGSGGFWVANTSTNAEDTAESGWSIRHNSRRKSNPNSVWVGNPESLMLDIRAEAVAPAPGIVLAATGGIVEDNFLLLGSGENAPLTEAAGPRRSKTFTVKLKQQPAATTTVNLDLQTGPGVVTFSPASLTFTTGTWNSTQTVTVTAVDDSFQDEHKREIFKIHLQAWINGLVADHGFVWGMVDDDETIIPPRIQFVSNMGGKNLELRPWRDPWASATCSPIRESALRRAPATAEPETQRGRHTWPGLSPSAPVTSALPFGSGCIIIEAVRQEAHGLNVPGVEPGQE